jgi:hypothetical protein
VTGTSIRKDGARSLKGVPVEIKHGHRSTGGDAVQRVARMASTYPKYLMLTFEQLRKSGIDGVEIVIRTTDGLA